MMEYLFLEKKKVIFLQFNFILFQDYQTSDFVSKHEY